MNRYSIICLFHCILLGFIPWKHAMGQSYDSVRYDMITANVHWNSLSDYNSKGFNADTLSKPLFCQSETTPTFVSDWQKGNDFNSNISKATNVLDAGSFYAVAGVYTKNTYDLTTHVVRIKGAFVCRTTTDGEYNEHWLGAIPSTNKNYNPLVYGSGNTPEGYLVGAWVNWWMSRTRNNPSTPDKTFIPRVDCNMPLGLFFESMAEFKIVHDSIVLSTYRLSAIDGSITQQWRFQKEIPNTFEPFAAAPWFKKFRPAFLPDDGLDWVEIVAEPIPCIIELRKQNNKICRTPTGSFNLLNFIWLKSQSIDSSTGSFYVRNSSSAAGKMLIGKKLWGGKFSYDNPEGIYSIAYVSPCGDSIKFAIEISGVSTPANLKDTVLCAGAVFSPNPNFTGDPLNIKSYSWNMGPFTGTTQRPIWKLSNPGNYTLNLTITDNNNCTGYYKSTVTVNALPQSIITKTDSVLCFDKQPFSLSINTPGDPNTAVEWKVAPLSNQYSKVITLSYPNPGIYTVSVKSMTSQGCVDSLQIQLRVLDPPQALAFDTQFCENETADLRYLNKKFGQSLKNISWNIPSLNISSSNSFNGLPVGTYNIVLTLENLNGCISRDTSTLKIYPKPQFSVATNLINLDASGSNWYFNYTGTIPQKAFWYRDGQLFSTQTKSFTKTIYDTGYANFKLVVFSQYGCADSSEFRLYLPTSTQIFTPNAFTPGKDGKNDFFGPYNYQTLEFFEMKVFNRWGELIFISSPGKALWDGTDSYGEPAMDGQYIYLFSGLQLNKQWLQAKGTVTLLRR